MVIEAEQYQNRIATVVGGRGQFGDKVVSGFESLGFRQVQVCEQGDPFLEFVPRSTDLFFAVDAVLTKDMLQSARNLLHPDQTILDGASVKSPLISLYRELDKLGMSVCSTHLGAVPTQPWRGVKVWICNVGQNSERASQLATDLYIAKNTSIQFIDLEEHEKIEQDQWFTMVTQHLFAAALRDNGIKFDEFDKFSTLSAELETFPLARILGQGVVIPTEVIFTQPRRQEFLGNLLRAFCELVHGLDSEDGLREFLQTNIDFHDNPVGTVNKAFRKAGVVGSRLANLRMYSFSFRIRDDQPGRLRELLGPFHKEKANLTAIDSMSGNITPEEERLGIDPDKIVDFHIGIARETIDQEKEQRIKNGLRKLGCVVD